MNYREIESVNPPIPEHTQKYYQKVTKLKTKLRKKGLPKPYAIENIPWDVINQTELVQLCLNSAPDVKEQMDRWERVHLGIERASLIKLIKGVIKSVRDSEVFISNPAHKYRRALSKFFYENWRYIGTQVTCNAECEDCSDLKPLVCSFANRKNISEV